MVEWEPKLKHYPHFDRPLSKDKIMAIVKDPNEVAQNAFYPFLLYYERKEGFGRKGKDKLPRPIRYAARRDSYILGYYRHLISEKYEGLLAEYGLQDSVLAYRKIPVSKNSKSGKCNIHFARDAFEEIKSRGDCYALALDISSYFEHIDHGKLYEKWCLVMGFEDMPADHQKVFNAVTNYAVVEFDEVCKVLGYKDTRLIGGIEKFGFTLSREEFFNNHKQLCSPKDFRDKVCGNAKGYKDLVSKNPNNFGIPQGSPISDVLANIYLLDFDAAVNKMIKDMGGYYCRYSDDILLVLPKDDELLDTVMDFVSSQITKAGERLEIKPEKTIIKKFELTEGGIECKPVYIKGIKEDKSCCFDYLGFSYDGQQVRIKDSTMARYYRKMKLGIRSDAIKVVTRYSDKKPKQIMGKISYSDVYQRYAQIKDFKALDPDDYKKWNFWTYAKRASEVMSDFDNKIMLQLEKQKRKIKKLIADEVVKQYSKHRDRVANKTKKA